MLNKIWYYIIIISCAYGICTGKINKINDVFMDAGSETVKICISMVGTMSFFLGIMELIKESKLINVINGLFKPVLERLFTSVKHNKEVMNAIILNLSANFLGLGNAATPFGIEAIHQLNNVNKDKSKLSDDMIMFLVLNTTCFQLLPTSIFAYRLSFGSKKIGIVFIPILIVTFVTTLFGIAICKFYRKKYNAK